MDAKRVMSGLLGFPFVLLVLLIGNKFVDPSLFNLYRVGDEYRIKINDKNEIDTIYFSYNKLIPISGSIKYLNFNNVELPKEFTDLKPSI